MKSLGKSASASRPRGSISVDRVSVLPNGDIQDEGRLFLSALTTNVAALVPGILVISQTEKVVVNLLIV